jgi:hypothetical protein
MTTFPSDVLRVCQVLADVAPPKIAAITRPGPHCVMSTSIGLLALSAFDVPADPWSVELTLCNQAWFEWGADKFQPPGIEEQERRGAYILSNTPNWNGVTRKSSNTFKPWDGHLVIRAHVGVEDYLVDLDLGAMNRPTKGIVVPAALVTAVQRKADGDQVSGTITGDGGQPTHLLYRTMVSAVADDYKQARDWRQRARFCDVVDEIVSDMKDSLK